MATHQNISGNLVITTLNSTDTVTFDTGNVLTTGNLISSGNINAQYILGNGSFLTGVVTTGTDGATGATGPQGFTGATGPQGFTGATGSSGVAGSTGPAGTSVRIIGSVGNVNIIPPGNPNTFLNSSFPSAVNGDGVLDAATGDLWVLGSGVWNDAGKIAGPQGSTGPQGPQGSTGPQGNIGATGASGVIGNDGATGASGLTGATGPSGGPVGATGASGLTGATGASGLTGATGAGATGASGISGTNGATGASGVTGFTGATGASGISGTNGATGASGVTGFQGSTGLTGSTGPVAGANTEVIFNNNGTPGATGNFTYNNSTNVLTVTGNISGGNLYTAGSGTVLGNLGVGTNPSAGYKIDINGKGRFAQDAAATTGAVILRASSGNTVAPHLQFVSNDNTAQYGYLTINAAGILSTTSSIVTTGTITTTGIINGNANGVGNIGSSTTYFNTVFATATTALYADLSEKYLSDSDYDPGTVVDFGGDKEVTISTSSHSTAVAGVVSTNPAYQMNSGLEGKFVTDVALVGRVPCQVVGTINKGDRLVSSDIPGVARRLIENEYQPGCIIGKAIESYDSDKVGVITVVVGRT